MQKLVEGWSKISAANRCGNMFSTGDVEVAIGLARYLSFHTALHFELAEAQSSTHSVPAPWPRPLWERILVQGANKSQTKIAYAMAGTCGLPQILRRRNFFDFSTYLNAACQALRRWLIRAAAPERTPPAISATGSCGESLLWLVDKLGLTTGIALEAATWVTATCWRDFQDVFWIRCQDRTPAGVLGEMAQAMHLRLAGTTDQNRARLREEASRILALYVFDGLPKCLSETANLGGKASVIVLACKEEESIVFREALPETEDSPPEG